MTSRPSGYPSEAAVRAFEQVEAAPAGELSPDDAGVGIAVGPGSLDSDPWRDLPEGHDGALVPSSVDADPLADLPEALDAATPSSPVETDIWADLPESHDRAKSPSPVEADPWGDLPPEEQLIG